MSDILNTGERRELPSEDFGLPERREYPMPDAAHVRARNILKFAARYGVTVRSAEVLDYAR